MTIFPANPSRLDPYKNSRFLVYLDTSTTPMAEVIDVSCLAWDTEVVSERSGGESNHAILAPGTTTFEPVVLTRGVTQDNTLADWANEVIEFDHGIAIGPSLKNLRKEVRLVLLNEEGQPAIAYILHRCWPSRYQPFGLLNAGHPGTLIESITIQYEGFERDTSVVEPVEN
jgi:phage tail-like protein